MRAPVGHAAAVVVRIAAPVREGRPIVERAEDLVVAAPRSGAEPKIPIDRRRNRFRRQIARARGIRHVVDEYLFHLANTAVTNQLAGQAELRVRTLLAAVLEDDVVAFHGIDHCTAFVDGQRHRLFAVDVFSCTGRHNAHAGVPMRRRRDQHGVDVRAFQHFTEVFIRINRTGLLAETLLVGLVHDILRAIQADALHIAQRHDARITAMHQMADMADALDADADDAHADWRMRRLRRFHIPCFRAMHHVRKDSGSRRRHCAVSQKITSVHVFPFFIYFLCQSTCSYH